MRRSLFVAAVSAALMGSVILAAAQNPAAAPPRPYQAIAITPPAEMREADFVAMRKQLADVAVRRDRTALMRLTVAGGFFWLRDGKNAADPKKSGIDNLAAVLRLTSKESIGWDMLAAIADDPTASPTSAHKGARCAPAEPGYDAKAFAALLHATHTDFGDWGYPVSATIAVHSVPGGGELIGNLPLAFVRLLPESPPKSAAYLRVLTAAGRTGYVLADSIAPIGNDQICYVQDNGAWKIGGYVGSGGQQ